MGETLIPARGKGPKDYTDSVFLQRYARRHEIRAQWMPWYHAAVGAAIGYGVALVTQAVVAAFTGFSGMFMFHPHQAQVQMVVWPYLTMILPGVFAVLFATRGAAKADELRFQSQMALHVLKLQDMILQERENG